MPEPHDTDYLIVGAGAAGLAFADTLLSESDARMTIVDRRGRPGGHWNDAYPFVTLHQPSSFYGVNSMPLGSGTLDTTGHNAGFHQLATGAELTAYFERVMHERLLPSGRVRWFPMSEVQADGSIVSLLSGRRTPVTVQRKTVDAAYLSPRVPATHQPQFTVAQGVDLVPPNALPSLFTRGGARPAGYVIVGAGKTAMDVGVWLLDNGAEPSSIHWVVPRDSWLLNRRHTQPGAEFFDDSIGGQVQQMKAFAEATSLDDLFARLEAAGIMLRIDRAVTPGMFHYATISAGEIETLRRITQVIRMGRVRSIGPEGMTLEQGVVRMPAGTLYIDCTASAVEPRRPVPMFQGARIVPQLTRIPQPSFSAAMVAYVEVHYATDEEKNRLCSPVPFPESLSQYPLSTLASMANQMQWAQDKVLRQWIVDSRLDGFGKVMQGVARDDAERQQVIAQFRQYAGQAAANIPRLRR